MKLFIYKDKKKEWRWRVTSKGRKVANGGEGYKRKGAMENTYNTLRFALPAFTDAIRR